MVPRGSEHVVGRVGISIFRRAHTTGHVSTGGAGVFAEHLSGLSFYLWIDADAWLQDGGSSTFM